MGANEFERTFEQAFERAKPTATATSKKRISKRRLIGIGAVAAIVVPLLIFVVLPIAQGSTRPLVVLSGSMSPAMEPGDIAVITQVDSSDVKVGDVIAYERNGNPQSLATHRVIEVIPNGGLSFRTKGDANEDPDQHLVEASSVVGRVSLTIPKLGYLFYYAKQPVGFLVLVVLPASLLIAFEIRRILKLKHARRTPLAWASGRMGGKK